MSPLRIALNISAPFFWITGGTPGAKGGNFRSSRATRLGISIRRTRFTGPCTRYKSSGSRLNSLSNNSAICGEQVSEISRRTASPKRRLRQFAVQAEAQVFHFLLIHEQVAVARHAELVTAEHFHAGKQLADMRMQDRGKEHEAVLAAADFRRHQDGARQHARGLHDGARRIAPESILALQLHGKIQALVEHARKGVRRIESDRR